MITVGLSRARELCQSDCRKHLIKNEISAAKEQSRPLPGNLSSTSTFNPAHGVALALEAFSASQCSRKGQIPARCSPKGQAGVQSSKAN